MDCIVNKGSRCSFLNRSNGVSAIVRSIRKSKVVGIGVVVKGGIGIDVRSKAIVAIITTVIEEEGVSLRISFRISLCKRISFPTLPSSDGGVAHGSSGQTSEEGSL